MMNETQIMFISWNVRGLGKKAKLKQVIYRLKQLKASIAFLQETHLLSSDLLKIQRRWPGQVYSASYASNARGVITLIHKSIPSKVSKVMPDGAGRYLILQGSRKYPNKSEFSCFSPSTKSYSRIDYFLVSNNLFPQIYDVTYESIVISDHFIS